MAIHVLTPERSTLHGQFSRELEPALTIEAGDTVHYRTLDAGWGEVAPAELGGPRPKFEPRIAGRDSGHALCGPVAIRGAEPGMTLEVEIGTVRPGPYGWTWVVGGATGLDARLGVTVTGGEAYGLLWALDPDANIARDQHGRSVPIRPFMGIMGMPPDAPGLHASWPPRASGGNIDCKELVAGSRLYLPVPVPGALFSVGDGHAAQGDGEVCGQAIECPMERVELTFRLREDLQVATPRARTPRGWITFGFHEDLGEATVIALNAMLDLMGERHALRREDALALASIVVDLRVTQIVNGVRGVHAILPDNAIDGLVPSAV